MQINAVTSARQSIIDAFKAFGRDSKASVYAEAKRTWGAEVVEGAPIPVTKARRWPMVEKFLREFKSDPAPHEPTPQQSWAAVKMDDVAICAQNLGDLMRKYTVLFSALQSGNLPVQRRKVEFNTEISNQGWFINHLGMSVGDKLLKKLAIDGGELPRDPSVLATIVASLAY